MEVSYMKRDNRVSRRDFIKTTAAGVSATALTGLATTEARAEAINWDKEVDVVVVGFGGAGASTAIAAHDAGAEVLIVEKAPKGYEGGNSRVCMQLWFNPEPLDEAITYFNSLAGPYEKSVPREMVRVWAEEMGKNNDFIKTLGGTPVEYKLSFAPEFPELPGSKSGRVYLNGPISGGSRWYNLLKTNVESRGIEVLFGTPGKELVQNPITKEILGVKVESEGWDRYIKARRAVVLTCGGFENNQDMISNFLTNVPYAAPMGTPYNTGDGIKMAVTAGADLWHMMNVAGMYISFKRPDRDYTTIASPRKNNYIMVGADGTRFVNEKVDLKHGKMLIHGQWASQPTPVPVYTIFDETVRTAGPLAYDMPAIAAMTWSAVVTRSEYTWSADNTAEIASGWIIKGDTIAELATKINLAPEALQQTIDKYNAACQAGVDADYGRPAASLSPLVTPPYYAMAQTPSFINTQGGPRRNEKAQIVRPDHTPIPRLYSSGELGAIYPFLYNGGGNIGECMAFGRIAGRNAAAETPWS
jgi:succinate dehydrogenase/fumarate reductase flavoprotein subunit